MRAVVQRCRQARVTVEGEEVGAIGRGLLVLVGAVALDGPPDVAWLAHKLPSLRVFPDDAGKMNRSVVDIGGGLLVVSQFTLCADLGKGTRPSFAGALAPEPARALVESLVERLRAVVPVATGRFGAAMEVALVNEGPVTLWLDSRAKS